jgi:C-terminal processing protease CtpA/Prc
MVRIGAALFLLLSSSFVSAQEAEKPKPKPAMVGVQLAIGKDEGSIEIRMVINNSPAEKAGLKSGDILLRINGIKPANLVTTVRVIRALKPGKKATFLIERDGNEKTLEVVPIAPDD